MCTRVTATLCVVLWASEVYIGPAILLLAGFRVCCALRCLDGTRVWKTCSVNVCGLLVLLQTCSIIVLIAHRYCETCKIVVGGLQGFCNTLCCLAGFRVLRHRVSFRGLQCLCKTCRIIVFAGFRDVQHFVLFSGLQDHCNTLCCLEGFKIIATLCVV